MSNSAKGCMPSRLKRRRTTPGETTKVHNDYSLEKQTVSVILSVLPAAIQSRLPPMPALARPRSGGLGHGRHDSRSSSGASTPPLTDTDTVFGDDDAFMDSFGPASGKLNAPSNLDMIVRSGQPPAAPDSAIEWRYGRPGIELLISAVEESENGTAVRSSSPPYYDASFERKAYLDGVSYLLRGMPRDLDMAEITMLKQALPSPMGDMAIEGSGHRQLPYSHQGKGERGPSVLHRTMRLLVARAVMWFCIVWPYLLVLLRVIAHYERKYKVTEQVVAWGIVLANACASRSAGISEAVYGMGDGKVGHALTGAFAWTVHSMVAGVSEGVEEGLTLAGSRERS